MRHGPREVVVPDVIDLRRLRLRRPMASDAEALFECSSDLEVARYMDWPVNTSIDQVIERLREREQGWTSGEEFYWVITLPNEDRAIGAISCRVDGDSADFGFFVNCRYWRNGYATEASKAIVDLVKEIPAILRLWATCDVENVASARVLEKAGLSREKRLPRSIVRPNLSDKPRDALLYSWVR